MCVLNIQLQVGNITSRTGGGQVSLKDNNFSFLVASTLKFMFVSHLAYFVIKNSERHKNSEILIFVVAIFHIFLSKIDFIHQEYLTFHYLNFFNLR